MNFLKNRQEDFELILSVKYSIRRIRSDIKKIREKLDRGLPRQRVDEIIEHLDVIYDLVKRLVVNWWLFYSLKEGDGNEE